MRERIGILVISFKHIKTARYYFGARVGVVVSKVKLNKSRVVQNGALLESDGPIFVTRVDMEPHFVVCQAKIVVALHSLRAQEAVGLDLN